MAWTTGSYCKLSEGQFVDLLAAAEHGSWDWRFQVGLGYVQYKQCTCLQSPQRQCIRFGSEFVTRVRISFFSVIYYEISLCVSLVASTVDTYIMPTEKREFILYLALTWQPYDTLRIRLKYLFVSVIQPDMFMLLNFLFGGGVLGYLPLCYPDKSITSDILASTATFSGNRETMAAVARSSEFNSFHTDLRNMKIAYVT